MEVNPQAVFAKLQARIAQLELDNAFLATGIDQYTGQVTALEKKYADLEAEHAACPRVNGKGKALPVVQGEAK